MLSHILPKKNGFIAQFQVNLQHCHERTTACRASLPTPLARKQEPTVKFVESFSWIF
jgi:hypothetical protein